MRGPTVALAGLVLLAASWAGAFGIALGVTEWRGGETIIERQTETERIIQPPRETECDKARDVLAAAQTDTAARLLMTDMLEACGP